MVSALHFQFPSVRCVCICLLKNILVSCSKNASARVRVCLMSVCACVCTQPGVYSRLVEVRELHNLHLPPAQWQGRRGQLPTPISSSSACWGISSLLISSSSSLSSPNTALVRCATLCSPNTDGREHRHQPAIGQTSNSTPPCPHLTVCLCVCLDC